MVEAVVVDFCNLSFRKSIMRYATESSSFNFATSLLDDEDVWKVKGTVEVGSGRAEFETPIDER